MNQNGSLANYIENLSFLKIFRTFRMAIQPSKLITALLAVLTVTLCGLLLDFIKVVDAAPAIRSSEIAAAPSQGGIALSFPTELHAYVVNPESMAVFKDRYSAPAFRQGLFSTLAIFSAGRFHDSVLSLLLLNPGMAFSNLVMLARGFEWALFVHPFISIPLFVIMFLAFTFAGGAICRISALEFANNEKPGLFQAIRFSKNKYKSLVAAPLVPVFLIVLIGCLITVFGLIGNIPYAGELILSIMLLITFALAFLLALLLIGLISGFTLMFPTIAYEGTDSFDALSRSFSYIYASPWRMIFYSLSAAVYGAFCYFFVYLFIMIMLAATYVFLGLGMIWSPSSKSIGTSKLEAIWPSFNSLTLPGMLDLSGLNWSEAASAVIISVVLTVLFCVLVSYTLSFFFSANTAIYALMRYKVDRTAISEVWTTPGPKTTEQELTIPKEDLPRD